MTLFGSKPPPANLTQEKLKAIKSLIQDQNIPILPSEKEICTVATMKKWQGINSHITEQQHQILNFAL